MPWIGSQCRAGLRHPPEILWAPRRPAQSPLRGQLSVDPEPGPCVLVILCDPCLPLALPSQGDAPPECPASISTLPVELCLVFFYPYEFQRARF